MISHPASLLSVAGARTGLVAAHLLDIETVEGNLYYWADRKTNAPIVILPPAPASSTAEYSDWLVSVGAWKVYRSVQSLTGSFVVQNISGDSMARDVEKILRSTALEGAQFVYREWDQAAQAAYREVHGTLTVDDVTEKEVLLKATGLLNANQGDSLGETYSETCQLVWGSRRCGATGAVECRYSFQSCQVVERFKGILNSYEKNFGEAITSPPMKTANRRRKI